MARVRFTIPQKALATAVEQMAVRSGYKLPEEVRKAVARGWSVIPQEEQEGGRKKPLVKWKPFQSTAPTMEQVQRWYSSWPDVLYAVVLGQVSGLVVFDFDGPEGVEALYRSRLVPYVRTPGRGGGAHVYVKAPAWPVKTRQQTGIPGVELKAEGGTATFYGEREAGWYEHEDRGRIYKPEDLPRQYRELLAEPVATPRPAPGAVAGQLWTPQRCAGWAMQKLYEKVPVGQLHNGRAATAHVFAIQLRDVPEEAAIEAMKVFHEQAGDLNSEGGFDPYLLTEAMETLKHARINIPEEWTPGPFAYGSADTDVEEVAKELRRIRVREAARREWRNEQEAATFVMPPALATLADDLAVRREKLEATITELHIKGGNTNIAAKYKTGKSTLEVNLMRSFTDGVPFLGQYPVRRVDGRVALWNYELIEGQAVEWLRNAEIKHPERACLWNLRGYRLPLTVPYVQEQTIQWLKSREVEVLLVDPFSRAYTGSENDNSELKQFTEALDLVKREAGVVDLFMAVHMGRERLAEGEERGRGATHLDDWPDNRWILTRDKDRRYFYAEGRDVLVPEQGLAFDSRTRSLTVIGGNRRDERDRELIRKVCEIVRDHPGIGQTELRESKGLGHKEDREGYIRTAIELKYIEMKEQGQKHAHSITERGLEFVSHKAVRQG